MSRSDFHFEFHHNIEQPTEALADEVERRLRELAADHTDFIGAAVTIDELSQDNTPHFYQARIVAYIRPQEIAAIKKDQTVAGALHGALEALERQVRKRRDRLGKPWEQTEEVIHVDNVYELSAEELYEAYAGDVDPDKLITMGRTMIAAELMTDKGLDQDAAFYAADEILAAAQDRLDRGESFSPDAVE